MKKSEAKSQQSIGVLEAPVQLTPEQLEIVAAGFRAALVTRQTLGDIIKDATICGKFPMPTIPTPTFQF
jgi:hypothetical protein